MKLFSKFCAAFIATIFTSAIAAQSKFSQPENYTVTGRAIDVPIIWSGNNNDSIVALLLPVKIDGIPEQFFMQLDFGSRATVFYENTLRSIQKNYAGKISFSDSSRKLKLNFELGKMKLTSSDFTVLKYGDSISRNMKNIIGTIGTDLLEQKAAVLDFKKNRCSFLDSITSFNENKFSDFEFKNRMILLPVTIDSEDLKLLYDSGSSMFELITNEATWKKYADERSKVTVSEDNSWGKTLKSFTAQCNKKIQFGKTQLKLHHVTYMQGVSTQQTMMMKALGMQGMLGNKIFMNRVMILDCKRQKYFVY